MPERFEKIHFKPEKLVEYEREIEELREKGGFKLEEKEGGNIIKFLGIRGLGPHQREAILEFDTEIKDEKEIKEILEKYDLQQSPLFKRMFSLLIDEYNQERIPLFQSVPGTGKTYSVKLFNELLHGKDAQMEYIACTPRTTELELIGHWTPAGKEIAVEEISTKLEKVQKWQEFKDAFTKKLESLIKRKDVLSEGEFQREFADLTEKFMESQKEVLTLVGEKTEDFIFRRGVILSGFKDPKNPEDKGRLVMIDEIDNLPESYQNILLQLSGPKGKLTSALTSYSDSGVTRYEKGKNTFFVLAANYPELAPGKRPISIPLADRVDIMSILPKESLEDEKLRIKEFGFKEFLSPEIFPRANLEVKKEIKRLLAETLALWHIKFKERLSEFKKEGLELFKGEARIREQEKEFSQRAIIGVEDYLLSHLKDRDFLNPETGRIDLSLLLLTAFDYKYLYFLSSENLRNRFWDEVIYPSLYAGRKRITEKGEIEEVPEPVNLQAPFLYIEEEGRFRPFDNKKDDFKKALPLDKVFEILVERASMSKEELEQKERQQKERELIRARYAAQDALESLLKNPNIPESIKEKIKNIQL
ncbi:MAG: hypothetical protein DRM99_03485 [Thermoplasmata archaeon]|nr:MAG: hypothetical protein DRM99_03485 [Thermoplasmata archaeon]